VPYSPAQPLPRLLALSDLHVAFPENRKIIEDLRPESGEDWLLLAGDVGELFADIEWALRTLSERFATVVWVPGNHELWTHPSDPVRLRGEDRYRKLVDLCRGLGVITPEDPYPVWEGPQGGVTIVPLFLLYDYTFLPDGALTKEEGLARAYETGIVCSDEALLHPDPYPSQEAWCWARVEASERRLTARDPALPVVFVNHYPLIREPTRALRYQQFAQWCGTTRTND
jgi:3',5'-cyclic AMP phosphodiesterase CpdA